MHLDATRFPEGLSPALIAAVSTAAQQASSIDLGYLYNRIQAHLRRAKIVSQSNPMVHVALAEAIVATYDTLMTRWSSLPASARPWIKGAMLYFVEVDDDDHDFDSPIGFDDDVEVLNACLCLAGLEELCLKLENFVD
jgi:hypothetical protein